MRPLSMLEAPRQRVTGGPSSDSAGTGNTVISYDKWDSVAVSLGYDPSTAIQYLYLYLYFISDDIVVVETLREYADDALLSLLPK